MVKKLRKDFFKWILALVGTLGIGMIFFILSFVRLKTTITNGFFVPTDNSDISGQNVFNFMRGIQNWIFLWLILFFLLVAFFIYVLYKNLKGSWQELAQIEQGMAELVPSQCQVRLKSKNQSPWLNLTDSFNHMAGELEQKLYDIEVLTDKQAELQQMRSEFVSNVSHELKTPLTSIRGFVDTLRQGSVEDEKTRQRFLEIIDIEVDRLHQLINDILELSEIEAREIQFDFKVFDLRNLIFDVADLLADKALKNNITIEVLPMEPLPVLASPDRIKQVLINLMDNAIKYNKPEGKVILRAIRESQAFISIQVQDTGMGVPPESIPRIFERFYRVEQSRNRQINGTGLGLSIVKHIAQLYSGTATVESKLGEGSCFCVKLKIACDPDWREHG